MKHLTLLLMLLSTVAFGQLSKDFSFLSLPNVSAHVSSDRNAQGIILEHGSNDYAMGDAYQMAYSLLSHGSLSIPGFNVNGYFASTTNANHRWFFYREHFLRDGGRVEMGDVLRIQKPITLNIESFTVSQVNDEAFQLDRQVPWEIKTSAFELTRAADVADVSSRTPVFTTIQSKMAISWEGTQARSVSSIDFYSGADKIHTVDVEVGSTSVETYYGGPDNPLVYGEELLYTFNYGNNSSGEFSITIPDRLPGGGRTIRTHLLDGLDPGDQEITFQAQISNLPATVSGDVVGIEFEATFSGSSRPLIDSQLLFWGHAKNGVNQYSAPVAPWRDSDGTGGHHAGGDLHHDNRLMNLNIHGPGGKRSLRANGAGQRFHSPFVYWELNPGLVDSRGTGDQYVGWQMTSTTSGRGFSYDIKRESNITHIYSFIGADGIILRRAINKNKRGHIAPSRIPDGTVRIVIGWRGNIDARTANNQIFRLPGYPTRVTGMIMMDIRRSSVTSDDWRNHVDVQNTHQIPELYDCERCGPIE